MNIVSEVRRKISGEIKFNLTYFYIQIQFVTTVILFGLLAGDNFTEAYPLLANAPLQAGAINVIRARRNTGDDVDEVVVDDRPSEDYHYDIVPIIEVEPAANAQQNDVLVIDEYVVRVRNGDDQHDADGDLDLAASSHIFRPLFRYRAEIERKRIIRGAATNGGSRPQRRSYYTY